MNMLINVGRSLALKVIKHFLNTRLYVVFKLPFMIPTSKTNQPVCRCFFFFTLVKCLLGFF